MEPEYFSRIFYNAKTVLKQKALISCIKRNFGLVNYQSTEIVQLTVI